MRLNNIFLLTAFIVSMSGIAFAEVIDVDANNDGTVDYRLEWSNDGDLLRKEMVSGSKNEYTYQKISKENEDIKVFTQLNADGKVDPSQMVLFYAKDKNIFMAKNIHEVHGVRTTYYIDNVMVAVEAQDAKTGVTTSKSFLRDGKEVLVLNDNDLDGVWDEHIVK